MLLNQLIIKKMEFAEESNINRNYIRTISLFYGAFGIAVPTLKEENDTLLRKNVLWKRFLIDPENPPMKLLRELQTDMILDTIIITRAQKKIIEEKERSGYGIADMYTRGTIGIIGYDYPEI